MSPDPEAPFDAAVALFQLISETNPDLPVGLSSSNVTMGMPVPMSFPVEGGVNTKVLVSAIAGQGYTGETTVYYRRRDIAQLWTQAHESAPVIDGGVSTWDEVRDALEAAYGPLFAAVDLPATPLVISELPMTLTWAVPVTSLLFTGQLDITLTESTVHPSLGSILQVKSLDGLTLPLA